MSYILDALRRADAERERDPARGIHAQPSRAPVAEAPPVWRRTPVVLAGIAAFVVLAGVVIWRGGATPDRPVPSGARPGDAALSQRAPAAATPSMASGPSANAPPATVATAVVPAAPPMPAPVLAAPSPAKKATPTAAGPATAATEGAAGATAAPRARAASSAAATVAASPAPAAAPAAADRILPMSEAPPEVQRLAISGGVYSENPAQRMLIVAGQVVGEGTEIAPGIVLEQIRPKSAVVRVRGQRVAVPY